MKVSINLRIRTADGKQPYCPVVWEGKRIKRLKPGWCVAQARRTRLHLVLALTTGDSGVFSCRVPCQRFSDAPDRQSGHIALRCFRHLHLAQITGIGVNLDQTIGTVHMASGYALKR